MINKLHRFHGLGSLKFVYTRGQTVRAPELLIKYVLNKRRQTFRVAVVVSKKVNKSAVTRNRIRRRIYEVMRLNQGLITQPYDIVITVFDEQIAAMPFSKLQKKIEKLLKQAKII